MIRREAAVTQSHDRTLPKLADLGLDAAEFATLQQAIVKLRNRLLKHAQEPRAEEPRRKAGTR
jgi:hypothetical protein